jgi:hypothetical protein
MKSSIDITIVYAPIFQGCLKESHHPSINRTGSYPAQSGKNKVTGDLADNYRHMTEQHDNKSPSMRYALHFGQIAIEKGFITEKQLHEALGEQYSNESYARLRPRKLIGEILFEKGLMDLHQIDIVLEEVFKEQD